MSLADIPEFKTADELRKHYAALKRRRKTAEKAILIQATEKALIEKQKPDLSGFVLPVVIAKEIPVIERDWLYVETTDAPSLDQIMRAVCFVSGFSLADMRGDTRVQPIVYARQAFYYISRHAAGESFPRIGRFCGKKNHTTVIYGVEMAANRPDTVGVIIADAVSKLPGIPDDFPHVGKLEPWQIAMRMWAAKKSTHDIALRLGIPESEVFNNFPEWRRRHDTLQTP